ncbi:Nramp family divalent metal transporter [Lewinella sp. W8]|uniref:Nramp family divalent metal transporter n=1 Tax=Lewinella sp. W8 TaxID=2528208 RepID=UPI001068B625|nr:Nramp family divalent metal transporter [Lewinella sp. W8]MTB51461.1 iron transporter [Lewinella sp. W8]
MAKSSLSSRLTAGLLVAATGIGAGDLVISAIAGATSGVTLVWAILLGALLKYGMNEGLARWELATGTTLLQGWIEKLPKGIAVYFGFYLVFWAFLVAATLITYVGQAANAMLPLPLEPQLAGLVYGGAHSLVAALLIYRGGFRWMERVMKFFLILLFFLIITAAVLVSPDWGEVASGVFSLEGLTDVASFIAVLTLIGGVGGTLTILCYSYWLRAQRSSEPVTAAEVRLDLGVAYALTALFGIAIMIIAAGVRPEVATGFKLVSALSERLGEVLGDFGRWTFLIGFWAAVFTSMIGVWNGVPYLFADFARRYRGRYLRQVPVDVPLDKTRQYFLFLLYLAIPPLVLVYTGRPGWIGQAYALSGAFFMPFLALTILYLNNQPAWMGALKNRWQSNVLLTLCLLLFLVLFLVKLWEQF